jgi:hypothetical protein
MSLWLYPSGSSSASVDNPPTIAMVLSVDDFEVVVSVSWVWYCCGFIFSLVIRAVITFQNTLTHASDQVNIGMFHPFPGMGIVYGTRQGKVVSVRAKAE